MKRLKIIELVTCAILLSIGVYFGAHGLINYFIDKGEETFVSMTDDTNYTDGFKYMGETSKGKLFYQLARKGYIEIVAKDDKLSKKDKTKLAYELEKSVYSNMIEYKETEENYFKDISFIINDDKASPSDRLEIKSFTIKIEDYPELNYRIFKKNDEV